MHVYNTYSTSLNFYGDFFIVNSQNFSSIFSFSLYNYALIFISFLSFYVLVGYDFLNSFFLDDQNVGPHHDAVFFIALNFIFLSYNFVFSIDMLSSFYFYVKFFNIIFIFLYLSVLLLCLGFYLILFIKGSAQSKFFAYTLFIDFIQINSFLIRVSIQFVRVVMLYGTLYAFYLG